MATVDLPSNARPRLEAPRTMATPRRRRPANAVVLMALSGLLFFLAAYVALRDRDVTHAVVSMRGDVPAGATLRPADLDTAHVQVDERVLAGLVRADGSAVGAVAANDLAAGELLSPADLRAPAAPEALRAMSLPIEPARAAGGVLAPGDRVDVIAGRDGDAAYIAQDLRVLDVSTAVGGGLTAAGGTSVTLAVDEVDALALARALETSTLHLVRATGATPAAAQAGARDRND